MPPIEADAAYQGCLPSCELRGRSLALRRTGKVRSLLLWSWDCAHVVIMQSPNCAHVLCISRSRLRTCYAISTQCNLDTMQSRDCANSQIARNIYSLKPIRQANLCMFTHAGWFGYSFDVCPSPDSKMVLYMYQYLKAELYTLVAVVMVWNAMNNILNFIVPRHCSVSNIIVMGCKVVSVTNQRLFAGLKCSFRLSNPK